MKGNSKSHKAYNEVRRNGGSKEEAREVSQKVYIKTEKESLDRWMGKNRNHSENESDFDSDINGNGTFWHTSEDL